MISPHSPNLATYSRHIAVQWGDTQGRMPCPKSRIPTNPTPCRDTANRDHDTEYGHRRVGEKFSLSSGYKVSMGAVYEGVNRCRKDGKTPTIRDGFPGKTPRKEFISDGPIAFRRAIGLLSIFVNCGFDRIHRRGGGEAARPVHFVHQFDEAGRR